MSLSSITKASLCLLAFLPASTALAQQAAAARQDPAIIHMVVEHFLRTQTAGLPGQVKISVNALDPRSNLAACAAPEPFLPSGGRVWGRTTIGVRCSVPVTWTVYIQTTIKVMADYVTTAAPLAQGQLVSLSDLTQVKGDLTMLPAGILTDPSQAVGRTVAMSLPAGAPLRQDALRNPAAVQQGQMVRLITTGTGFRVSSEGKALNNAADGQVIQARTAAGQVISGIARAGGIVEVTY